MNDQHIHLRTVYELRLDESGRPIRYVIPAYQRGYRWTSTQVTQLLDDLREFARRKNPQPEEFYCLQPLVLLAGKDGAFDVVDGQQRLTTLLLKVVQQLEDILAAMPKKAAAAKVVQREVNYFHEHQDRMDYRAGQRRGEPIGSGAIESTCRQAQCRFKRPGQYWSQRGDESLLCLETFWRNGHWHLLFPHNRQLDLSKN